MSEMTVERIVDEQALGLEESTTVHEAIDEIRTASGGPDATVYYVYVLGEDGRLTGVVSMRELLNATDETPIGDVKTSPVILVEADAPVSHAARTLTSHGFTVVPVVDGEGRFQGVVRADDVIEALDEEATKDVLRSNIRDIAYDPGEAGQYECFDCGNVITAENAEACPKCGGNMRNVRTPLE